MCSCLCFLRGLGLSHLKSVVSLTKKHYVLFYSVLFYSVLLYWITMGTFKSFFSVFSLAGWATSNYHWAMWTGTASGNLLNSRGLLCPPPGFFSRSSCLKPCAREHNLYNNVTMWLRLLCSVDGQWNQWWGLQTFIRQINLKLKNVPK